MSATATRPRPPFQLDTKRAKSQYSEVAESYRCCNDACESWIQPKHVLTAIHKVTGIRTTTTYCEHCTGMYRRQQILEGGLWRMIGEIELITSARQRAAIIARIDEKNRTIHIGKL
ncbi:MAG TPA: hypothetical protein VLH09_10345 [Bryobacteraceae bacterium]|nr:hypothetical protein [Bryobacteraceae bacterium]